MLIYLDESYGGEGNEFFILGALFNPHSRYLHRRLFEIKKKYGLVKPDGSSVEIKYVLCKTQERCEMNCEVIDAFIESTSWFRCIVIEKRYFNLDFFGKQHEEDKIKKARAYKKFTELLLEHNTENIQGGVLLTDEMTRCRKDLFVDKLTELFCEEGKALSVGKILPTLKRIEEVKSDLTQYQVLQVCDLLIGCVLNNLAPTRNNFKNDLREYLVKRLKVKNLLRETWGKYSKRYVEEHTPKFNVWYFTPENK